MKRLLLAVAVISIGAFAAQGQTSAVVNYTAPIVSDNCGIASNICVPPTGAVFNIGTTPVNCPDGL